MKEDLAKFNEIYSEAFAEYQDNLAEIEKLSQAEPDRGWTKFAQDISDAEDVARHQFKIRWCSMRPIIADFNEEHFLIALEYLSRDFDGTRKIWGKWMDEQWKIHALRLLVEMKNNKPSPE